MKRTLAILLCALFLIPAFAVCASANEVYTFQYGYVEAIDDSGIICAQEVPDGTYILYMGKDDHLVSDPFEIKFEDVEIDDGFYAPFYQGVVTMRQFPIEDTYPVMFVKIAGVTIYYTDDVFNENTYFRLVRVTEEVDPLPSVNETLDTCINWVGQVLNALISGELNGLLLLAALPIAITVVMLSIKFIRRNSWGC